MLNIKFLKRNKMEINAFRQLVLYCPKGSRDDLRGQYKLKKRKKYEVRSGRHNNGGVAVHVGNDKQG